jgi:hypothetical protein
MAVYEAPQRGTRPGHHEYIAEPLTSFAKNQIGTGAATLSRRECGRLRPNPGSGGYMCWDQTSVPSSMLRNSRAYAQCPQISRLVTIDPLRDPNHDAVVHIGGRSFSEAGPFCTAASSKPREIGGSLRQLYDCVLNPCDRSYVSVQAVAGPSIAPPAALRSSRSAAM